MRPTMLMFRSPKERTPEFYAPKITFDGHLASISSLNIPSKRNKIRLNSSFSKQKRFNDYKILARITSKKIGPGTYDDFQNFRLMRQKPWPTKIKQSVLGDKTKDPWYMYIGNSLVFEPEFSRSFKPKKSEDASIGYNSLNIALRPWSRMWHTIHSASAELKDYSTHQKSNINLRETNISIHSKGDINYRRK